MKFSRNDFLSQNIAEINSPIMIAVKNEELVTIFFSTYENFKSFDSFNEDELNS